MHEIWYGLVVYTANSVWAEPFFFENRAIFTWAVPNFFCSVNRALDYE